MKRRSAVSLVKPLVFISCLLPIIVLSWNGLHDKLSANPISDITNETGLWTLRFIVITLALTPLRKVMGWHWLIKFRRMIGLFAFFYGFLHFTTYIWLDQFFDWQSMAADISKRPFITVGFASFVLMVPLAVTSTQKMIRRLGGKRWDILHRLIYFTGVGAVIHYMWLVKVVIYRQIIYAAIVAALLLFRLLWKYRPSILKARRPAEEPSAA
ncbi:MAG: protein-methionine-sulfoxide reductase heme-binding subunit MsrQ [Bacteroidota bacterium]